MKITRPRKARRRLTLLQCEPGGVYEFKDTGLLYLRVRNQTLPFLSLSSFRLPPIESCTGACWTPMEAELIVKGDADGNR